VRIINEKTELVSIEKLKPHPKNPRQGDVGAIHVSIEANGFYGSVIAQKSTGHILAGNHRFLAAKHANAEEVPVTWVDVSDEEAVRILLADNRTNDLATYNEDALAELIEGLMRDTGSIEGTGYDGDDLDELLKGVADVLSTEMPELPTEDRDPFQRVTFTLHDEQVEVVERALSKERRNTLYKFTKWMRAQKISAAKLDEITESHMGGHYITEASQPAIPTKEVWAKIRPVLGDVPSWVEEMIEREDGVGNENARGNSLAKICRDFLGESNDG
jgi:hypothetical protein